MWRKIIFKCYKSRLLILNLSVLLINEYFDNHGLYYQYAYEITYYPYSIMVCTKLEQTFLSCGATEREREVLSRIDLILVWGAAIF